MRTPYIACVTQKLAIPVFLFVLSMACFSQSASAQKKKTIGIAAVSNNAGFPFSEFGDLFRSPLHAGIEFSYGFNWKTKARHEWFQQFRAGYFYHRYVQHGIPLYTSFGYRYKIKRFFAEASLGAGYLHSIPATAQFKLSDNGEYRKAKGIGRMQGMASFDIGLGYVVNPASQKPFNVFAAYQQRIQTPFVKSYVPLMPYNNLLIGIRKSIQSKTKKS